MRQYHVERLKPFFGSRQDAIDLANRDTDQCDAEIRLFHTEEIQIPVLLWNSMSSLNLVTQFGCLTLRTFFK